MKRIKLVISDEAYSLMRQAALVRHVAGGSHGILDSAMIKIIDGIEGESKQVTIETRRERRARAHEREGGV